jgi:hypothetical protein
MMHPALAVQPQGSFSREAWSIVMSLRVRESMLGTGPGDLTLVTEHYL